MKDAKQLYQDLIVEHSRASRNEGPLADATHEATARNPLCGDRVTLRVALVAGAIVKARFEARGCMIARASASLLTEAVCGRSVQQARDLAGLVHMLVELDAEVVVVPDALRALSGAQAFPARRACVTLSWKALTLALDAGCVSRVSLPPTAL